MSIIDRIILTLYTCSLGRSRCPHYDCQFESGAA